MATSASSATAASSGVSSSSSPEVRTVERLKKKGRRKSLRERLVASWSLHAADGGATDPAKPRHSAGLHKVQGGRVVGLARDYEEACCGVTDNSSTNNDRQHNNNDTPRRRFDGSSSAGSPRPGLRYKNGRKGATEMYRSSPVLGSPPVSARRDVDAFRSEGNLSSYVQTAAACPAEATSTTTTTTSATDGNDGGPELKRGAWWRPKKMFGKSLKKTKKKTKKNEDESEEDEDEEDKTKEEEESEAERQASIHVLIKRSDVEGITKLISSGRKPKRGGETGGVDDVVNLKSALGSTPLHTAVEVGDLEVVQLLLRSGANPDLVDGIGWTPLLAACKAGNLSMAQALLVDGKADANSKTNDLNTPLHYLAGKAPKDDSRELYYDVMTRLLGKEGKVYGMVANNTTARNKNGDTPLHYAAMHGRPEVVRWLLDHHAAVNNQNTYGDTALHCAVIRGDAEMVQLLLKSGASKSLAGRSGTPKEIAKSEHADNASLLALF